MRCFVVLAVLVCFVAMVWSAAIDSKLAEENSQAVYDVPEDGEHVRQARQFGFGFGRPYGGYYGGGFPYGGYYGRPYGGFGGGYYGRPYGGFYGGYPYGGGFYG